MHVFDYASQTTRGAREYQEDNASVWPGDGEEPDRQQMGGRLLAVLADGMGGHTGGALASQMACAKFIEAYTGDDADTGHENDGEGSTHERLLGALNNANNALADRVAEEPMLSGMGCTLIGVSFTSQGAEWVSVGDSPLYLYRRGEVAQLNEDHSLAPELDRLAAAGRITAEQAKADPRRHMLRSAVTGEDLDLIDLSKRPLVLEEGDYIILASDGLQTLDVGEIERIVSAYAEDGAERVAGALIRAVESMRDPHQDNATVVAVRVNSQGAHAGSPTDEEQVTTTGR